MPFDATQVHEASAASAQPQHVPPLRPVASATDPSPDTTDPSPDTTDPSPDTTDPSPDTTDLPPSVSSVPRNSSPAAAQVDPLWPLFVPPAVALVVLLTVTILGAMVDPDGFVEAKWILSIGAAAALVASGTMLQTSLHRRRDRRSARRHLDAIESLTQV